MEQHKESQEQSHLAAPRGPVPSALTVDAPLHTPSCYSVRSLSPAFWYVYSVAKARRERGRGQVGRPYGSKAEAERAAKTIGCAA